MYFLSGACTRSSNLIFWRLVPTQPCCNTLALQHIRPTLIIAKHLSSVYCSLKILALQLDNIHSHSFRGANGNPFSTDIYFFKLPSSMYKLTFDSFQPAIRSGSLRLQRKWALAIRCLGSDSVQSQCCVCWNTTISGHLVLHNHGRQGSTCSLMRFL